MIKALRQDDPSVELRRDAVQGLVDSVAKSGKDAAVPKLREALGAARDVDQIDAIAKRLGELGDAVDLRAKFGWVSEWRVDETMQALSVEAARPSLEAIVVGLWNTPQRASEYTPFTNWWKGTGEAYVAFIIDTLKPMIDGTYWTQADAPSTAMIGSSLGGLISLYAFFARPDVFGLCGALSPALWPGAGEIYKIVQSAPNNPGRVYIDNGTREPSAKRMVDVLSGKGYVPDGNLKYISERGGQHNEAAWARRFPEAVRFLLG